MKKDVNKKLRKRLPNAASDSRVPLLHSELMCYKSTWNKKWRKNNLEVIMNMQQLPTSAQFSLDREIPRSQFVEGVRPTVTILLRDLQGGVLLVCPRQAERDAFMFPQDAIGRHETPRAAASRLLHRQCLYHGESLDMAQATALGISPVEKPGEPTKIHHMVFVSLRKKSQPVLNFENQSYLFAKGPNFLWSKVAGCRPEKRRLIVTAVTMAVQHNLLCTDRWNLERIQDLRRHGGVR